MLRLRSAIPVLLLIVAGSGCIKPTADEPTCMVVGDADPAAIQDPQYLQFTPTAAAKLEELARREGAQKFWVRYEMVPGGCTGLTNKLDMDIAPPGDAEFEFRAGNVNCILLKSQRHFVQGTQIDWGVKDGASGFIITAPNATPETKAAVAKWIQDEFEKRNPGVVFKPDALCEIAPPPRARP